MYPLIDPDPDQSVLPSYQWLPAINISLNIIWQGTEVQRYIVFKLLATKTTGRATKHTPLCCIGGPRGPTRCCSAPHILL
mmetsp:Transcript_35399/g.68222  ORF Transcript_35399/g.68222 Transcript_35399/m.68222 type:complete len:80 (+) Transcript_35399:119-358(+)